MAISLTLFKSAFDNTTHKRMDFQSFSMLEDLLYVLAERPLKGKRDAELISPAVYTSNTTRANKNVLTWAGWCAVDIDDIDVEGELEPYVRNLIPGWRFCCYSTASSRPDKPKFRLVLPLSRDVEANEIRHFWYALQSELNDAGDKQCKDFSRMYYIPATYADANNFIFSGAGAEQVVAHRKSNMTNTNIFWNTYHECPFWPRRLATEYTTISETGWYHKMYQMMVAISARALEKEYPITASQIALMCKEFDNENGGWYENRPRDLNEKKLIAKRNAESDAIYAKPSTRNGRTLAEVRQSSLYGLAAEQFLIEKCGFNDDPREFKDVFSPSGVSIEVKVTSAKNVGRKLSECDIEHQKPWRNFSDWLFIFESVWAICAVHIIGMDKGLLIKHFHGRVKPILLLVCMKMNYGLLILYGR